ncbi:MAG: hypothetical protein WBG73_09780 [Coleofasciculaceae cyanobacterium]
MSLKKLLKNAQSNLTAIASPLRLALVAVGSFLLLFQPIAFASTKLSAEAVIDQIFRSEVPLPGGTAEQHQNMSKLKAVVVQWLGSYQGVRAENGRSVILFERGTVPVRVEFKPNGEPQSIVANECPVTSVPISQAPREYQKALTECPDLKP